MVQTSTDTNDSRMAFNSEGGGMMANESHVLALHLAWFCKFRKRHIWNDALARAFTALPCDYLCFWGVGVYAYRYPCPPAIITNWSLPYRTRHFFRLSFLR